MTEIKVDNNDIKTINDLQYIKVKDVFKYLGVPSEICRRSITKDQCINVVKIGKTGYISLINLYNMKQNQENFWGNHIGLLSARKLYKNARAFLKDKTRVEIPYYARIDKNVFAYCNKELEEAIDLINNQYKDYITRQEAMTILNLKSYDFTNASKAGYMTIKKKGNVVFLLRKDVVSLKEKQDEFCSRFISYKEATEVYGKYITEISSIKSYPIPAYAKRIGYFEKGAIFCYDRFEIEEYTKIRFFKDRFYSVEKETHFDTFKHKLSLIADFNDFIGMPYTRMKWFNHAANVLSKMSCDKRTTNIRINSFVKVTITLEKYLILNGSKEIYSFSTNKLNMFLDTLTSQRGAFEVYKFLKLVAQDIALRLNSIDNSKVGFTFDKILNPLKKRVETKEKEIAKEVYDLSDYKKLFNFLNNVNFHKSQILQGEMSIQKIGIYLSTWLYLTLHLNNAWRNRDVTNFPRLYLDDIEDNQGINEIEWFKNNGISLPTSRQVMARIVKYDLGLNKTKVEGHFFCSDRLAPTLATILFMQDLYIKHIYTGYKDFNSPVMQFFNKYNEPAENTIASFLQPANIENFKFSSKKMNASIMTYINNLNKESENPILLPQYMRSHLVADSTLHYIDICKEDFDFLSEQLFMRGEFGYIFDSLLQIVNKEQLTKEENTNEIVAIRKYFGDELKIESTLSLLNHFDDERKEIFNLLERGGLKFCLKTLEDIYLFNLPSKEANIQCLYSETGCIKPKLDCSDGCNYSIPTLYALDTICKDLKNDLIKYQTVSSVPIKMKLSLNLNKKKELIKSAMRRYGHEYVYKMMDITREDFINLFSYVLEPQEIIGLLK